MEADTDCNLRGRLSGEELAPGLLDPSADQIAMRWDSVFVGEAANQVGLVPPQVAGDGLEPKAVVEVALQVVTQG
jgi:hypothetical protein